MLFYLLSAWSPPLRQRLTVALAANSHYVAPCFLALGPPVFAGVIFAGSFRDAPNPGPAFGSNITDSVLGGLAESFSMLAGVPALTIVSDAVLSALRLVAAAAAAKRLTVALAANRHSRSFANNLITFPPYGVNNADLLSRDSEGLVALKSCSQGEARRRPSPYHGEQPRSIGSQL